MSDIEMKRAFVLGLYPGPGWKRKVKRMPDSQVIAIFLREKDKPKKDTPRRKESGTDEAPF